MNRSVLSFLLLALFAHFAYSQEATPDLGSLEMEEVVVTYKETPKIELSTTVASRYIPMDKSNKNLEIAEVIARQPGIKNQRYGSQGSFSTVSIRGADGKRVGIFVDGVLQNSAVGGAVDLSKYSGLDIEAIRVYRGVVPAELGGNSLGGAINIITRQGGENRASISFLAGSFGEYRGIGSLTRQLGETVTLYGSLDFHHAQNDYPYWDRNNTPYNPDDDTLRNLQNNRYMGASASMGTKILLPKQRQLKFDYFFHDNVLGLPGGEWGKNKTSETSSLSNRVVLDYRRSFEDEKSYGQGLTFSLNNDRTFWTSQDHFGVAHGILADGDVGVLESKDYFLNYHLFSRLPVKERLSINSRFDFSGEKLTPESDVEGYVPGYWDVGRLHGNVATDLIVAFGGFSTSVGGAFGLDFNRTAGGVDEYLGDTLQSQSDGIPHWSARFGLAQKLVEDKLSIFANANRYSRAPSLTELYGFHGGILPNVNLEPESGFGFEVGGVVTFDKISTELIYFQNYRENMIIMVSDGVRSRSENLSSTLSLGVEQAVLWEPLEWLSIEENFTYQFTQNRQTMYKGNRLPNEPMFIMSGNIGLGDFKGISLHTILDYTSYYYRDMANAHRFPETTSDKDGLVSLSLYLAWQFKGITLEGSVIHLTDNREKSTAHQTSTYSSLIYPGRRWQAQIKYDF